MASSQKNQESRCDHMQSDRESLHLNSMVRTLCRTQPFEKSWTLIDVQWDCVWCHEQIWLLKRPFFMFLLSCEYLFSGHRCTAKPHQTTMCTRAKMIPKATVSHFRSAPVSFKRASYIQYQAQASTPFSLISIGTSTLLPYVSPRAWSHFSFIATFPFHLIWSNTCMAAQHLSASPSAPNRV